MRIPLLEDIPCWYKLRFDRNKSTFVVHVHKDTLPQLTEQVLHKDIVRAAMSECHLTSLFDVWSSDYEAPEFGIGGCIKKGALVNDFQEYFVHVPQFVVISSQVCARCEGTKKEVYIETECFDCRGTGKAHHQNWHDLNQIGLSLSLFLHMLDRPPKIDTSCSVPQSAVINFVAGARCGITGTFTPVGTKVIKHHIHSLKHASSEIRSAMEGIHTKMFGGCDSSEKYYLRADINPTMIALSCCGNACGTHTVDLGSSSNMKGIEFSDHNVDSTHQALTLLAGKCVLMEKIEAMIPALEVTV